MLKALYTAAMGMLPQQTRLEVASNNIANANTTGYKRIGIFEQSLVEARQNMLNIRGSAEQEDAPIQQFSDFTLGALTKTDNPLDLALDQEGFFVVQDSKGNEYFTRSGHFSLDSDGKIITGDGKSLMGEQGELVVNNHNAQNGLRNDEKKLNIRISDNGEVFADNQFVGRVRVMSVKNPQSLERSGGVDFVPSNETDYSQMSAEQVRLKQGFLESANVNIIQEMVNMIQLQRSFEMGQKVIHTNDGTLERSIDIGRFSA